MWEVHYSQEAATYLEDNATLITGLFFTIESWADSEGKPSVGDFQEVEGIIFWNIQDHLVVLRRMESLHIVRVIFMKPE